MLTREKVIQDSESDISHSKWSQKFSNRIAAVIEEKFQYFLRAVYTTMSFSSVLDNNKQNIYSESSSLHAVPAGQAGE